jgi:ribosomal protein S1
MELEDEKWNAVKRKLKVGDEVEGVVVAKPPFGDFLDIGAGFPALLEIIDIDGLTPEKYRAGEYTPMGSRVKATIVGFADFNKQIRVSQRPMLAEGNNE